MICIMERGDIVRSNAIVKASIGSKKNIDQLE